MKITLLEVHRGITLHAWFNLSKGIQGLPLWISSSTAWRLNSSPYLRAILLFFTVVLILLWVPASAKSGEAQDIG